MTAPTMELDIPYVLLALPPELVPEIIEIWDESAPQFTAPHNYVEMNHLYHTVDILISRYPGTLWGRGNLFVDLTHIFAWLDRVAKRLQG